MGKRSESISARYEALAAAVATGESVKSAAARLKLGLSNAHREARTEAFRAKVREFRDESIRRAADRLAALSLGSVGALQSLLKSQDENIKLRAAAEILRSLVAVSNHAELVERLAALERRLDAAGRSR